MDKTQLINLLPPCLDIAKQAGQTILQYYQNPEKLVIHVKTDSTPVTAADFAAHKIIVSGLSKLETNIPTLSEEAANIPFSSRKEWTTYWLIDPLDGTKEFLHRTGEFTVNIALIENGFSILGIIYAPVTDVFYFACQNHGAYKQINTLPAQKIHTRPVNWDNLVATLSRRHSMGKAQTFLTALPKYEIMAKGSSLKSCIIAEGLADIYPCFGKTSEWDMGAAQCIIQEAGGKMCDLQGQPIYFNQKASFLNPPLLVAGDPQQDWLAFLEKSS